MTKLSNQDILNKAEWEGGLTAFIFDYGVYPDECKDKKTASLVKKILSIEATLQELKKHLEENSD